MYVSFSYDNRLFPTIVTIVVINASTLYSFSIMMHTVLLLDTFSATGCIFIISKHY